MRKNYRSSMKKEVDTLMVLVARSPETVRAKATTKEVGGGGNGPP